MVAEIQSPREALLDAGLEGGPTTAGDRHWWHRLTSAPSLAITLMLVIIVAAGPFQSVDLFLAKRWLYRLDPSLLPFAQNVLDPIAGQAVCLPLLLGVAVVIAALRQSWRPLLIAGLAELGFLAGIGSLKVLLARGVAYEHDPRFLEAGLFEMGDKGISFPSGHASEAVLIYGAAVYLIAHYTGASHRLVQILQWAVVVIAVNSSVVSFLLGWHWASDLVGGLLAGGLVLRLLVNWDLRARRRAEERRAEPLSAPS
ncbi:phosphatidic acid phosphatase [Brachybacterium avium]|uniref:Phosphatidic acid phosphatase n=1 Tax=Brachybacterium avium TaxID=2017485 RepID=A0A220UB08_9MICO|nr:phosphatase PAP2 family protein [Brachybacterium avium]ASK65081.1 phosphatidic acid phosphatase [Brachybacterium avium]